VIANSSQSTVGELKDTLTCAICLGSIEKFVSASCVSCVCEGIFHTECLARVPTIASHAVHGGCMRCPCCRSVGDLVELHKEVHRMCPPGNKRESVDRRVRQLWLLSSNLREALEETERELRRSTRLLGERVNVLKGLPDGNILVEGLLYPSARRDAGTTLAGTTLCRLCGEGIMNFSELMTQACHCNALYHSECLKKVVDLAPPDKIPCCLSCRSLGIAQGVVSVKELVTSACLSSPRSILLDDAHREASEIREQQTRCLERLREHLKTVDAAVSGLKKRGAPRMGDQRRSRLRLAYLPT